MSQTHKGSRKIICTSVYNIVFYCNSPLNLSIITNAVISLHAQDIKYTIIPESKTSLWIYTAKFIYLFIWIFTCQKPIFTFRRRWILFIYKGLVLKYFIPVLQLHKSVKYSKTITDLILFKIIKSIFSFQSWKVQSCSVIPVIRKCKIIRRIVLP